MRRLFFGNGIPILIMEAGQQFIASGTYYRGYKSKGSPQYGTLTPSYIMYKGTKYTITYFYSSPYNVTLLVFNTPLPASSIVVEVNGVKYTLTKGQDTETFSIKDTLFKNTGTHKLRFLSIE